jgi:hypothetical protein
MRNLRLTLAVAGAALAGVMAYHPARAAAIPNGSETFDINGPNTVNTPAISLSTTSLTISNVTTVGSFLDPFKGNPNNFCGAAAGGCAAANSPGFLLVGSTAALTALIFPVAPVGSPPTAFADTLTLTQGGNDADFSFTSIFTSALVAATAGSGGTVTDDLLGTISSNPGGQYTLGQNADMIITCGQTTSSGAISCSGVVDTPATVTPPPSLPEPMSLMLLGSALIGFGVIRRRRKTA